VVSLDHFTSFEPRHDLGSVGGIAAEFVGQLPARSADPAQNARLREAHVVLTNCSSLRRMPWKFVRPVERRESACGGAGDDLTSMDDALKVATIGSWDRAAHRDTEHRTLRRR